MYCDGLRREMIGSTPPHSRDRFGSFQTWIAWIVPFGEPFAYRLAITETKSA